jgi:hypothetical protein
MPEEKKLLAVVEFLGHAHLKAAYVRLGYQVSMEFTVRKANALMRKLKPDVIAADFYYEPNFRDRVSNLESLLATAQGLTDKAKILVFYDPAHQEALDKLRQRFRIDAALTLPVKESDLETTLKAWL